VLGADAQSRTGLVSCPLISGGSPSVLVYSIAELVVSFRILLYPLGSANA
jgi:hypothetical protein